MIFLAITTIFTMHALHASLSSQRRIYKAVVLCVLQGSGTGVPFRCFLTKRLFVLSNNN